MHTVSSRARPTPALMPSGVEHCLPGLGLTHRGPQMSGFRVRLGGKKSRLNSRLDELEWTGEGARHKLQQSVEGPLDISQSAAEATHFMPELFDDFRGLVLVGRP